ncbi:MAG TPA: (2Fe-2S)-binding protein [Thermoleophilaceae bacterium]|nr:(2Fe-2S)-binding protein [Thermoleophilaceae bacterium]
MPAEGSHALALTVNGEPRSAEVEPRMLLADLLRDEFGLTGTHLGCEHGVCGACTVVMDGRPIRSCLTFAVQAAGTSILTVEGLARGDEDLHPLQERFRAEHALQCGFCTPGFLMTAFALLEEKPHASEDEVREALDGVLCRCTGYDPIVRAVLGAREGPAG